MFSNEIDWELFENFKLKTFNSVCLTFLRNIEIFIKIHFSMEWMKFQGQLDKGG